MIVASLLVVTIPLGVIHVHVKKVQCFLFMAQPFKAQNQIFYGPNSAAIFVHDSDCRIKVTLGVEIFV